MPIENLVPIVVPALFVILIAVERLWPARPLPRVRAWRIMGVVAFALTGVVSSSAPLLYQGFVERHRLMDLSWLGLPAGTLLALLVTELAGYWFHRLRHTRVLWPSTSSTTARSGSTSSAAPTSTRWTSPASPSWARSRRPWSWA